MEEFGKEFLRWVGLRTLLTPCCQQTQNVDAITALWFWDRATLTPLKDTVEKST